MFLFFLFLFFSAFASQPKVTTVIVQIVGTGDGGFDFLRESLPKNPQRYSNPLNPTQAFYRCDYVKPYNSAITYTNNLAQNEMDLGGRNCIEFYKKMIIEAHNRYPEADIFLVGSSQGSVGPFGALAQLAGENHPVIPNIKKVLIEAVLGTHEAINFGAQKIPILKILPRISKKIAPLIAEYVFSFTGYDAFAPQIYHYIEQINLQESLNHINFLLLHDQGDQIIPCICAQNAFRLLLTKKKKYFETTIDPRLYLNKVDQKKYGEGFRHIPSNSREGQRTALQFLNNQDDEINASETKESGNYVPDRFFINKTRFQRFIIRRVRDACSLATLFLFYKGIQLILWSMITVFKTLCYS